MPRTSVQHIKRKERLSANDLTRLIYKKKYGVLVVYNHANFVYPQNGWYAYFTNQPKPKYIGSNWVIARDSIQKLPDGTPYNRIMNRIRGAL